MSSKSKKKSKGKTAPQKTAKQNHYSGINSHKRQGAMLLSPMSQIGGVRNIDWVRNYLPEHLWIGCLCSYHEAKRGWEDLFAALLDAVDEYVPEGETAIGFISDFDLVPKEQREEFLSKHEDLVRTAFFEPFGRIAAFYSECPARWLAPDSWIAEGGSLDPEVELGRLSYVVRKLLSAKDPWAGDIRSLPPTRMFKHGRIVLPSNNESVEAMVELLLKYPYDCTENERYQVQGFLRAMMNSVVQTTPRYEGNEWARQFWRKNRDLVSCKMATVSYAVGRVPSSEEQQALEETLKYNSSAVEKYLVRVGTQHRYDLYHPEQDEVLLGLFARVSRLYLMMLTHSPLWVRDLSGIVIRCMADATIIFSYLAKRGTDQEFDAFIEYGRGKEKLLMLHLQDTHEGSKSVDGQTSAEVADGIGGGFAPELVDINLTGWSQKSERTLAFEAGMEQLFRLVYSPTSSDVHGDWSSLRRFNLAYCDQPLHRYHRIPILVEPPILLEVLSAAHQIYQTCVECGVDHLGFPSQIEALKPMPWATGEGS